MTLRQTALEFLRCFSLNDLRKLESLLTEDFQLNGPLAHFDSRDAYIAALKADPVEPRSHIAILHTFQEDDTVCILYRFSKPPVHATNIAQTFTYKHGKISKSLLIFDTKTIAQ